MITECYIKGRFDYGVGKCAVVITEDAMNPEDKKVLHQVAWKVPDEWSYNGETINADQFNCEILAATYALDWCMKNGKNLVNIYANTTTCQKWYMRCEFPESRSAAGKMYLDMSEGYQNYVDMTFGEQIRESIYAEYIKKDAKNEWNWLVNDLALGVK